MKVKENFILFWKVFMECLSLLFKFKVVERNIMNLKKFYKLLLMSYSLE